MAIKKEVNQNDFGENAIFTWSFKFKTGLVEEMCVVRSNSASDIQEKRRDILAIVIAQEEQAAKDKPTYYYEGDICPVCTDGVIVAKTSKEGKRFAVCSNYAAANCEFSGLLSKFPKKQVA